jgi:hypothetical protein
MEETIILSVVVYGFEFWFNNLKQDHRLKVSENRVIRRIFGRRRQKWRGLE